MAWQHDPIGRHHRRGDNHSTTSGSRVIYRLTHSGEGKVNIVSKQFLWEDLSLCCVPLIPIGNSYWITIAPAEFLQNEISICLVQLIVTKNKLFQFSI